MLKHIDIVLYGATGFTGKYVAKVGKNAEKSV